MKQIFLLIFSFSLAVFGHEGHEDNLKAGAPLPSGNAIFQLGSSWQNQKGVTKKLTDLRGRPRLVAMLFTRCESACPLLVEDLKRIADEIDSKQKTKIGVSIFSLDSFRETPESLSVFSLKRRIPSHWELYTSNADAVAELAAALGVRYKRLKSGDFIHSNIIYFLDINGEVIAQKEGLKTPNEEFIKKIKKNL